ncbi:MAG: hypothetical protein J0M07_11385 [Anaerolineae bacterium]|nr:hypothetical protein [Chloroflexota bacterium]MBN8635916.1 hypothetical protein [Anaerolineae bacterium]
MAKQTVRPMFPVNRVTQPSPDFAEALREDSNRIFDWLYWASRMKTRDEQLYCFERAHYIDPYNREALDGINQLQRAAQQRLPVTAVVRRPWGTSAIDEL